MPDPNTGRPLPLDDLHRAAGCGTWTGEGGYRVSEHYGDPESERAGLTGSAVLHDASAWGRVELLGPDARRLLQGFCTVDVEDVEVGAWAYGLIPAAKGQVLADAIITAHQDRLWLRLPPGEGEAVREHLGKYVIAEQVELLPMSDLVPLWVLGPEAASRIESIGVEVPPYGRHHRRNLLGTEVQLEHGMLLGLPGVCLSLSASIARDFAQDLARQVRLAWCGRRALESARIRAGAPRWGSDFGVDTLPQEAGLNAAVDYEKGCYLGQEVIARLHYRGKEQRRLCLVEAEGATGNAGTSVRDGDAAVGTLTSLDPIVDDERAIGIALLRRSAFETRQRFTWGENGQLRVIRLLAVAESGVPDTEPSDQRVASSRMNSPSTGAK